MKQLLTLEALEVIDQIELRGSYASAAEHLNKVPSALSYIVQKLEEQLGVTLFQRRGRRSVLTPAGKHLLKEGRLLLDASRRLAQQTQELATGWEPRIRIAIDTIIDPDDLLPLLGGFLEQYPNVELDISQESLGGTWEALIDDRVDLVVGADPPVPVQQGIRSEVFGLSSMVFAISAQHPLAQIKQVISPEILAQQRWVVVHDSSRYAAPRDTGMISSEKRLYVQTISQKIAAQLGGLGVGYLPRSRIAHLLQSGELVELQSHELPERNADLLLAWKSINRGRGLKNLVELLKNSQSSKA